MIEPSLSKTGFPATSNTVTRKPDLFMLLRPVRACDIYMIQMMDMDNTYCI